MYCKLIIHRIFFLLFMMTAFVASCTDDMFMDGDNPFGEGESVVTFNMEYRPMTGTQLGGTRAVAGDAIKTINNVFVAWYKEDGTLAGSKYMERSELTVTDAGRDTLGVLETVTEHAEFKCPIPYGRYRIYAVANVGDISGEVDNETDLRSYTLTWNSDDIPANCQMSGYFSTSKETAYAKGEAPLIDVNKRGIVLHSWVRRAASKVTIAFDAKKLNENIYIYIQSAQIKDIPYTCSLIDSNTPVEGDSIISGGDMIMYGEGSDYKQWPKISCGRGANYFGNHADNAPSLFFYENMQGKHPDKHLYNNFDKKDNVAYGTYVEVKGYYVNNSATAPSYGNITYRCMLGKNMTDDFNAERNCHYRLTLVFNKDANDPDWHIEYDYEPQPPEIVVPNPMYISYLSNQELTIPVTVYYDNKITEITSMSAKIIQNDWGYYDHEYNPDYFKEHNSADYNKYKSTFDVLRENYNGFLSLSLIDQTALSDRVKEYVSEKNDIAPVEKNDSVYRYEIPVYTRPMNMGSGFSGNNYYVGRRRYAKVLLTATLKNGSTVTAVVDVIQVRRLVNPKGIWRRGDSTKQFRVTLKNSDSFPTVAEVFEDVISDGPWTAKILKGEDWVRIKDTESSTWGTAPVTGGTGSKVEFDYKPATEYKSGCRFGLIEITFHNNTCPHIILVSQGIGPVDIGGRKWHMTNVEYCGKDVDNPLLEGSMFKFGNSTTAFLSSNNLEADKGFRQEALDKEFDVYTNAQGTLGKAVFKDVRAYLDGFSNNIMTDNGESRVADYSDWNSITDVNKYTRYYGVLYGDECTETLSRNDVTNTYTNVGDVKGMRGCFVCDKSTGTHLFFPIGNTGHGRRQYLDNENCTVPLMWGTLKYANRTGPMPLESAIKLPCLYDLWVEPGAVYWYGKQDTGRQNATGHFGFDINYLTFGFESYQTKHVWEHEISRDANGNPKINSKGAYILDEKTNPQSDICFVRRVYTK